VLSLAGVDSRLLGPHNIIVAENRPVLVVVAAATCEPGPQKKLRAV
jgi:hypothetical protein